MGEVLSKVSHLGGGKQRGGSESSRTEERITLTTEDHTTPPPPPPPRSAVCTPDLNLARSNLLDPRSVTLGIVRTPLVLPSEDACETPRNATTITYVEELADEEKEVEASPELPAQDDRPKNQEALTEIEEVVEVCSEAAREVEEGDAAEKQEVEPTPAEESLPRQETEDDDGGDDDDDDEEERDLEERKRALGLLRKKLFFTPDPQKTSSNQRPLTTKGRRTPLGIVCHNKEGGMMMMMNGGDNNGTAMMERGWKVMSEERARLGLENTPPHALLPPLQDKVFSSSPCGKTRHSRARWDTDSTLLI